MSLCVHFFLRYCKLLIVLWRPVFHFIDYLITLQGKINIMGYCLCL